LKFFKTEKQHKRSVGRTNLTNCRSSLLFSCYCQPVTIAQVFSRPY